MMIYSRYRNGTATQIALDYTVTTNYVFCVVSVVPFSVKVHRYGNYIRLFLEQGVLAHLSLRIIGYRS